jgi:hypothetical protein
MTFFSKKARRASRSPAARRKAVATMKRNRAAKAKLEVTEIPLDSLPPYKKVRQRKLKQGTIADRIIMAHKLARQIVEMLS